MKKLVVILLLSFFVIEASAQTATIYVMRKTIVGAVYKFPIEINNTLIGKIGSKKYFECTVPAGQVTVSGMSEKDDVITFVAQPGQKYYLLVNVGMGVLKARANIARIDSIEGEEILSKLSLEEAVALNANGDKISPSTMTPVVPNATVATYPQVASVSTPVATTSNSQQTTNGSNLTVSEVQQHYIATKYAYDELEAKSKSFSKSQRNTLFFIGASLPSVDKKLTALAKQKTLNSSKRKELIQIEESLLNVDKQLQSNFGLKVAYTTKASKPVQQFSTQTVVTSSTGTTYYNNAKAHYEKTKHSLVNIMKRQTELLLSSSDREELGTINDILSQCNNKLYTLGQSAANGYVDISQIQKVENVLTSLDKRLDAKYASFLATLPPPPAPVVVQQAAAPQQMVAAQSVVSKPAVQSRTSDVDINIPETGANSPNTFVLIIANENYEFVDDVQYALNDGETFREYCVKTLGVPERQVWIYKNASAGIISGGVDKMLQAMSIFDNARAIVYYCGHGIPDEKTGDAYIVPTDGKGTNVATCYSLNKLYKTLSTSKAESVTYFMDACFTGANRDGSMLVAARGVAREAKKEVVQGNTVVFSAASGDETAMPYKEKQHGLFTYYLLKKLQETKGQVSYGELADYIRENVKKEAFLTNEKPQNPVIATSEASTGIWRNMKM